MAERIVTDDANENALPFSCQRWHREGQGVVLSAGVTPRERQSRWE